MTSSLLGAIADDFTGGADLAGMLYEGRAATVQMFGVPSQDFIRGICGRYTVAVVCLKTRSGPGSV